MNTKTDSENLVETLKNVQPIIETDSDKVFRRLKRLPVDELKLKAYSEGMFRLDPNAHVPVTTAITVCLPVIDINNTFHLFTIDQQFLYDNGYLYSEWVGAVCNDVVSKASRQISEALHKNIQKRLGKP